MRKILKIALVIVFCCNLFLTGMAVADMLTNDKDPSIESSKTLDLNTELNRIKIEEKEVYADFSSKRQERDNAKKEYNDLQDKVIEQEEKRERQQQQQEQKTYNNYNKKSNKKKSFDGCKDDVTTNRSSKGYVYWASGGKSYHKRRDCLALKRSKHILEGYNCPKTDPCNICYR